MTVYCEDCDNVAVHTRSKPDYQWLCLCRPIKHGKGFVTRRGWVGEPYERCHKVNRDGECSMFTPLRSEVAK